MPAIVGLAYFPDVATQLGLWAGYGSAKLAGHSALVGLAAGVTAGIPWARLTGASPRLTCALAVGSILAHDALDEQPSDNGDNVRAARVFSRSRDADDGRMGRWLPDWLSGWRLRVRGTAKQELLRKVW